MNTQQQSVTANRVATQVVRVFVVDDHAIVRQGLSLLLAEEPDVVICGEAGSYQEALEQLAGCEADVLVADITLKDRSGLELIRAVRQERPAMKMLVLSMHAESDYGERALRAGADGYVMKENADETIVEALRTVLAGGMYFSAEITDRMMRQLADPSGGAAAETGVDSLTDRERDVFRRIGQGCTTREIAEELQLSARTVEVHRAHIKKKLNCRTSAEVFREAVRWVEQ